MKYLENRNRYINKKNYKDIIIETAVKALKVDNSNINRDNIFTIYLEEFKFLLNSIQLDGYKSDALKELLEDIDWNNKNINKGKSFGDQPTINEPIIPDALMVISNNSTAIRFNNYNEYKEFADAQKYFSASHSHCFYSQENMEYFHKNGSKYADPDEEMSDILFNTGREIVQVWDNKNQIGYIVPGVY